MIALGINFILPRVLAAAVSHPLRSLIHDDEPPYSTGIPMEDREGGAPRSYSRHS